MTQPVQMPMPDEEELSLDRFAGSWFVYQLKRGHRFSSDDMLTAWMAVQLVPEVDEQLDLGAGIGSVGLLCLWCRPNQRRLVMVEAQEISHHLALKTVAHNGIGERIEARLGDLRDPQSVPERDAFPLVTGSPPYFPVGCGIISPHPQRAACRMELRGNIADYARAAARAMTPEGWFVFCFAAGDPRAEAAGVDAGLHLHIRQDVVFRLHQAPTIALFAARRFPPRDGVELRAALEIRRPDGEWTDAYMAVRRSMGFVS